MTFIDIVKRDTLRSLIIGTLNRCNLKYDDHTINQILGTMAVESDMGQYERQIGGPALGFFQMEPRTRKDIVKNYLAYRPELRKQIEDAIGPVACTDAQFVHSMDLQTVFCYLHYRRFKAWGRSLDEYASNWKLYYNTYQGKGTVTEFKEKYRRYVK